MLKAHAATSQPPTEHVVLAQQHFHSEMQKCLICMSCQGAREVNECFWDFSLDFPGPMDAVRVSLHSMLSAYFASEVLEAKCHQCSAIAAHMGKVLTSPPRVLVLHLKRFVSNAQKRMYYKQHQSVDIPIRLNLQSCLDGPNRVRLPARPLAAWMEDAASTEEQFADLASGCLYDLRAIVAHEGASPQSGHYVCYARNAQGAWCLYDDANVQVLQWGPDVLEAVGKKAYIVFYVLQC